jgi:hypothetical protein
MTSPDDRPSLDNVTKARKIDVRRALGAALLLGAGAAAVAVACGGDDTTTGGSQNQAGSGGGSSGSGGTSSGTSGSMNSAGGSGGSGTGGNATGGSSGSGGSSGAAGTGGGGGGGGTADAGNTACKPDLGYALQFRGTGDDRVHADITKLPINQEARTIELWAYFDGSNLSWHNEHGLFEYGQKGGCHEFGLNSVDWAGAPGEIHPYGNCDEIDNFFNMPNGAVDVADAGQGGSGWVHISYSYDAAGKQFHFTLNGTDPMNGPPANRNHAIGNWPGSTFSTMKSPLRIGTTDDFAGPPGWQGKIDELRVWNVYRSTQQIHDNMRVIMKGNEPGLVAYYHFDEGKGTSSADATGDAANAAQFVGTDKATWPMWVKSDIPGTFTCAP